MPIPDQRVPLTTGDLITREWLRYLKTLDTGIASDSAATDAAIAALQAEIDAVEADLAASAVDEASLLLQTSTFDKRAQMDLHDAQYVLAAQTFGG